MAVRKEDYIEWRNSYVTRQMYESVLDAAITMTEQLAERVDSNPSLDQYQRGYIKGVRATVDWEPEFIQEEEQDGSKD